MIGLALSMMLAAAASADSDPLAPAMAGQVQCYTPDTARRTCRSIGAYAKGAGGVQNTAIVLVSATPLVTMETTAPVQVKGRAICGTLATRDLATARFRIDGQPADPQRLEGLRNAVGKAMEPLIGHEICSSNLASGSGPMTAQASLDGKRAPTLDQQMIWVSPRDGYRVAP
jgi:hypothetical protein